MAEQGERMRAVIAARPGGPEALQIELRSRPAPSEREIPVRVEAAGVNRPDVHQRQGNYPPPPGVTDVLGLEIAGEVAALGPSAAAHRLGARVTALVPGGGYADYCVAHESNALPIPAGLTAIEAAAIPETYFTVWANVFVRGLKSGETLLLHGGTSGIGTTAIALAKAFGARVVATAGSDEKAKQCERLGADLGVNHRKDDFVALTLQATAGRGADVILDMVGGDMSSGTMPRRPSMGASSRSPSSRVRNDPRFEADHDQASHPHRLDPASALAGGEGGHRRGAARQGVAAPGGGPLEAGHRLGFPSRRGRERPPADRKRRAHRQGRVDDVSAWPRAELEKREPKSHVSSAGENRPRGKRNATLTLTPLPAAAALARSSASSGRADGRHLVADHR